MISYSSGEELDTPCSIENADAPMNATDMLYVFRNRITSSPVNELVLR